MIPWNALTCQRFVRSRPSKKGGVKPPRSKKLLLGLLDVGPWTLDAYGLIRLLSFSAQS